MKKIISFSRVVIAFCVFYIVFDLVSAFAVKNIFLGHLFSVVFDGLLIVYSLLLMSYSKTFKRPAVYVVIASSLSIVNALLYMYMRGISKDTMMMIVAITGVVYLFYLVFVCLGFFKLGKLLPKPSLSRSMAIVFPCTFFVQLVLNMLAGVLSNPMCQWLSSGIGFLQILIIALLVYFLPKNIAVGEGRA